MLFRRLSESFASAFVIPESEPLLTKTRCRYFTNPGTSSKSPTAALNKIFDKYREDAANSPDTLQLEAIMAYMGDIGVNVENLDCLAVMEIVKAPSMSEIEREGFVKGWAALQ